MLTELNLSEEEIRMLNYERYYYPCPKIRKRLHVLYIKGTTKMRNKQVGLLLDVHPNSVSRYIRIYKADGFEGICKTYYRINRSRLESYKQTIIDDFTNTPLRSISHAVSRIKLLTGIEIKPTRVRVFLRRHGFKYRKMSAIPGKVNVEKQRQWLEKDLTPAIKQAEKGEIHLLFSDAAHFTLSAFLCMIWSVKRVFLKTSHGRNRINVLGAVDAITKEITTLINTTYITATTIMDFLEKLKEKYSDKPIVMVLDNAKYQHCNLVKEKAEKLGITLMFLPPYSPNLNIIERLWKFTKKKILYAKYYDTAEKFHMTIRAFFEQINKKLQLELEDLLTLKFQLFDDEIMSQNQPA
jgi:Transposase and inactivated derivatives